jgi:Porin subfamily
MIRKRNLGSAAAIGGLTAAVALLTGLPAASADELADLRANQELLQRRIDQLAQAQIPAPGGAPGGGIPGAMGAQPIPGQSIVGGSFPRSFLIPGTDTSIRIGGFVDLTANDYLQGGGGRNGANNSSTVLQNGTLESIPLGQMSVPGLAPVAQSAQHSRGNNIFEFSPNQSRINIETRTPTAWGESRTFFEFDWAGCNNFSCQTLQQGGGDNLVPRLRFAYGTLGGFLAGQAISNFSDADADTESMEFGGSIGSTGGYRVPQVRYTLAGPYGSAWSVAVEQPHTDVQTPAGVLGSDTVTSTLPGSPGAPVIPVGNCNGVPCTGTGVVPGTTMAFNPARQQIPNFTFASYWAQPWGHVDFAGLVTVQNVNDGKFINKDFVGYGGHIALDVKPGWFGWAKDDILGSFVIGNGIGNYASGGEKTLINLATNFGVATSCATPTPTCTGLAAASNILFKPIFTYSTNGGYQHWWTPSLRSTLAAGIAEQDMSSQLIGPNQAIAANKVLWDAFANLVWNPVAFVTTGVQYSYGKRIVVANGKGQLQALTAKFRVAF